ncbi:outer membrane protein [Devosia ginsengisoli]|uniref:outer membrane protein n=1 Tax=Devosia ginsengisoli TaxID=400770 RepID=UPI0026EA9405|nr:outer membrane protein [Devosia ginsengisoli]MCR6672231.1 porin family protein [Devosia ginsengisoli]
MKRLGIMLSAIALLTSAGHAADLGWNSGASPIYSPTPASGWSGFYAGVSGGYGFGSQTVQPAPGAAATNNTGGWNLGGQVGYNMDMGGFIIGAEGDLQWANVGYSEALGADTFRTGIDFYGTLRGRAGMAFGQVMPYVTGGLAAGRGTASLDNGVVTTQSATHMGWTAGIGLEAQATENITIKAEYLYVDLGTQTYNNLPAPVGNIDVSQRFSVVRAGINYKF